MKRTFIAITTYNQADITKACLASLVDQGFEIVVFDDCSTDHTKEVCNQFGVKFVTRKAPKGLTYSWNLAYKMFIDENYDFLIISNNDVLFPQGAINNIIELLANYPLVCPMTRKMDAKGFNQEQAIENHYDLESEFVNDDKNYQKIQDFINHPIKDPIKLNKFYAFCFGLSREIRQFEFSKETLFNPKYKIVGQEEDFQKRFNSFFLSPNAFVYHYQGSSVGEFPHDGVEYRNSLTRYHPELQKLHPISYRLELFSIFIKRKVLKLKSVCTRLLNYLFKK